MSAGSVIQKIDELYKKASLAGEQGNLQLALQYYEEALQLAQENNFTNLAQSLEQAVNYTKKLIEVNSLIDDAIQNVYRGNYKQAYEEVEKAVSIAKELGVVDEKIEDIKKAIGALAQIPEFKFETKIVNLQGFSKFIKSLLDYYTIAKEKAQEAVAYYPEFAPVLQFFLEMKGELTILNDAVSQLVNAENIASSISRDNSYDEQIKTIDEAISQVKEAKVKASSLAPTNEFVQKLQQTTIEFADSMMKSLTEYKAMIENLKKSKEEADAGNYSKAVFYLEQAQEISNANNFGVNLQNYIKGFTILEGLEQLPQPGKLTSFSAVSSYFAEVEKVLQHNYKILEEASQYITISNLNEVQTDIVVADEIKRAFEDLHEANQLLTSESKSANNNNKNNNISSAISSLENVLNKKPRVESLINSALTLLNQAQTTKSDFTNASQQLFSVAKKYADTVSTYFDASQHALNSLKALKNANNSLKAKVKSNSASEYFSKLANIYAEALKQTRVATSEAIQANQLFESINLSPPFDVTELENQQQEISQFINLFTTSSIAFSNIENAENEKPSQSSPRAYAEYYGSLETAVSNGISQIEGVSTSFDSVTQAKNEIIHKLNKIKETYHALSHAYSIVANAENAKKTLTLHYRGVVEQKRVSDLHALAQGYKQASTYLQEKASELKVSSLAEVANQFNTISQFYSYLADAQDAIQNANNTNSIQQKIEYLQQAVNYLNEAKNIAPQSAQQQIQAQIDSLNQLISTLENVESYQQKLNEAIQNGQWLSALVYYNEILEITGQTNINNVIEDVANNNYFQAIADVDNNNNLTDSQKAFLKEIIATAGINTYYIPLMNDSLQQAHLQASNWIQAFEEAVNFQEQVQPILQNLSQALQYVRDAEKLAKYLPDSSVENSLSNIENQIYAQYQAIEEQVQKANNPIENVLLGIANTVNNGINNLLTFVNNEIYQYLGKNTFTEILAGVVDALIFVAISLIPVVGQVFDVVSLASFIGETLFDYFAGSYSRELVIDELKSFISPQNISMLITSIVSLVIAHRLEIDDAIAEKLGVNNVKISAKLGDIADKIADKLDIKRVSHGVENTVKDTVKSDVDFSKIQELVKEVDLKKLDIKTLSKFKDRVVQIESESYDFFKKFETNAIKEVQFIQAFKDFKIKLFKIATSKIDVNISRSLDEIKTEITPGLSGEAIASLENGKIKLTTLDEETLKQLIKENKLSEALDLLKKNFTSQVVKQLFDELKSADGNTIKISNDEAIAYFNGKLYDVFYKDGQIAKMEEIDPTLAQAKLMKYLEDKIGSFFTLNASYIESLIKSSSDIKQLEYVLSNKIVGNVVRNEYLVLKDALGNEIKLTSKSEILPGQIKTTTRVEGEGLQNIPVSQKFITPQEVTELLSFDNPFSNIFKQLVDAHPEVKDLLEKLASQGKLSNDLTALEDIANKIKSFYDSLSGEIADVKSELSRYSDLFDGVNVDNVINNIIKRYVINHASEVLDGEKPDITLAEVLDSLSTSDKARVVLNYIKSEDPQAYADLMQKLGSLSQDAKDYVLASAFDQIKFAIENGLSLKGGLESVLDEINSTLENFREENITSVNINSANINKTANTSAEAQNSTAYSGNGQVSILKPPKELSGVKSNTTITTTLSDALKQLFPEFEKLNSTEKDIVMYILSKKLEETGELTAEDIKNAIEKSKTEVKSIIEEIKKFVDNADNSKVESEYKNEIINLTDKLASANALSLAKLSEILSSINYVASKFNTSVALSYVETLTKLPTQFLQNSIILTPPQIDTLIKLKPLVKSLILDLRENNVKIALKKINYLVKVLTNLNVDISNLEELTNIVNLITQLQAENKLNTKKLLSIIVNFNENASKLRALILNTNTTTFTTSSPQVSVENINTPVVNLDTENVELTTSINTTTTNTTTTTNNTTNNNNNSNNNNDEENNNNGENSNSLNQNEGENNEEEASAESYDQVLLL